MTIVGTGRAALRAVTVMLALVLGATTLTTLATLATPGPAAAATERYCSGYGGCSAAGYSDQGYGASSQTYWWRMELGHNCTAYAAYRMVRSGLANTRPWSGVGDAHRWGHEMARITDQVPRVGSVAWWDEGAGGRGRLGHVAYVEKVLSPDTIVVSQDVYEGDFSWARISRGSGWPSGFIHFNDERLRVESAPRVLGRARVGVPLRVTAGRFSDAVRLSYRWLAGGRELRAATRSTYTPTPGQVRARIQVRVTATNVGYAPVTVTTAATRPVGRGVLRVTRPARVTGEVRVGRPVRLRLPRVSPRAHRTRVRWLLDGRTIRGARARRLVIGPDARGRRLTVETTLARRGYEPRTTRLAVGRVRAGTIVVRRPFRVDGQPVVGQELQVVAGGYTPADARLGYLWFRDGDAIGEARGATYVVGPEDAGHRLAVVIGLRRRGYANLLAGAVAGVVPEAATS